MAVEDLSDSDADRSEGVERIADPDDYNLRRRLKELRDAKAAVKEWKDRAVLMADDPSNEAFFVEDRDRMVADKLVDYIHELRPSLRQNEQEEEFLNAEIELDPDGETILIGEIADSRGRIETGEKEYRYLTYRESMRAWDLCNNFLEQMAGARFESDAGPDSNPVDPAGRFDP